MQLFVLIVYLSTGSGFSFTEFDTMSSCEKAGKIVQEIRSDAQYRCVKK